MRGPGGWWPTGPPAAGGAPGRERRAYGRWVGRRAPDVELEIEDDRFWREVRKLPERQAQAVALFYLEDLPVADVAVVLGSRKAP